MGTSLDPVEEKTWLVRVDFLPPSCWPLHTCGPFIGFKRLHFYFPSFQLPREVFFLLWLVLRGSTLSFCMYRKSIFVSFVILYLACLFIY